MWFYNGDIHSIIVSTPASMAKLAFIKGLSPKTQHSLQELVSADAVFSGFIFDYCDLLFFCLINLLGLYFLNKYFSGIFVLIEKHTKPISASNCPILLCI